MLDSSYPTQTSIPPCTDFTITIPYNPADQKFDRSVYSPAMTGGRATSEDIEFILHQLETIIKRIPTPMLMMAISFLFVFLPVFGGVYFSFFISNMGFLLLWIGMLLYLLILTVSLVAWKKYEVSNARNQAIQVIRRNQPAFQAKGLRWHIPLNFPGWVELYKDYRESLIIPPVYPFHPMMVPHNMPGNANQVGYPLYNQRQEGGNMYQPPVVNQGENQGYPHL